MLYGAKTKAEKLFTLKVLNKKIKKSKFIKLSLALTLIKIYNIIKVKV